MINNLDSNKYSINGLYDPVQRIIKTIPYIEKTYGPDILKQLKKETEEARRLHLVYPGDAYSENLVETIRNILVKKFPGCGYDVKKPLDAKAFNAFVSCMGASDEQEPDEAGENIEPEINIQRQRQKGDDFFMMLERGLFLNPAFRKIFKSPFTVYGWLWSKIVRKGWKDKKGYPIKANYYDKGLLAYCSSYRKVAKECFMDKDTAKKYIGYLESKGILKVDSIVSEGKMLPQGVYILGEWTDSDGKINEKLYLKQILLSEKEEDKWDF